MFTTLQQFLRSLACHWKRTFRRDTGRASIGFSFHDPGIMLTIKQRAPDSCVASILSRHEPGMLFVMGWGDAHMDLQCLERENERFLYPFVHMTPTPLYYMELAQHEIRRFRASTCTFEQGLVAVVSTVSSNATGGLALVCVYMWTCAYMFTYTFCVCLMFLWFVYVYLWDMLHVKIKCYRYIGKNVYRLKVIWLFRLIRLYVHASIYI